MRQPLVSILIPLYNKAGWIDATLRSALAQTYGRIEVLVIDDGSSDGSVDVAKSFADPRLTVLSRENRGANATRNQLLTLARGEFVQYLDADDILVPQKIQLQVADMLDGASVSICAVERAGRVLPAPKEGDSIDPHRLVHFGVHTTSPLHRKAHIVSLGGWSDNLPAAQEWDLHCRLFLAGAWDRPAIRSEVLSEWSVVPGSVSSAETAVYRAKLASITSIGPTSDGPMRQALADSAANAGRHLARARHFKEAGEAFDLAALLSNDVRSAWPRHLGFISRSRLAPAAEWLDHTSRSALSSLRRRR